MKDYMRGGTNEAVSQGDLKGSGGAAGGAGGASGYVFGSCNEGCSQGHPSASSINTGQNDASTVHSANDKGAILSKLGSAGMAPNAKEL